MIWQANPNFFSVLGKVIPKEILVVVTAYFFFFNQALEVGQEFYVGKIGN